MAKKYVTVEIRTGKGYHRDCVVIDGGCQQPWKHRERSAKKQLAC